MQRGVTGETKNQVTLCNTKLRLTRRCAWDATSRAEDGRRNVWLSGGSNMYDQGSVSIPTDTYISG